MCVPVQGSSEHKLPTQKVCTYVCIALCVCTACACSCKILVITGLDICAYSMVKCALLECVFRGILCVGVH